MLGGVDARPALIVRVADTDDVAAVIALARDHGLELAVRSGGHSGAAHGTIEGGIVIDVRDLDGFEIDETARTAWAGGGLTTGAYTTAAAEIGLATGFGDTGSVGIGGITTGGGIGYLVRSHGLTIDSLLAAEIVTADGAVHVVDESHEPDLFWAIRGAGANVGVVTRFKFRLYPLSGIVGGMLLLPATADTIDGFVQAADAAPEGLSTIANVMPCPPMPFVPAERHGEVVILALMCWAGPQEEADAVLAPFRALATPIADMLAPIPYTGMYPPEPPDYHPLAITRTLFMDSFDRELGQTIVDHLDASDAEMRVAQIRVLGGAMARVDPNATAFAHRDRRLMVNVASFYTGDRRSGAAGGVGDRPRRCAAPGSGCVRELPGRRGPRACPRGLPGQDVGPARRRQASLRPGEPVPPQPEHPARGPGGVSEKPVAAKLLIKAGNGVWLSDASRSSLLGPLPEGATVTPDAPVSGSAAVAIVIGDDAATVSTAFDAHAPAFHEVPVVWVLYPKGNRTDVNRDSLWRLVAPYGLRPITQVAVDETWSALRFRPIRADEPPFTGGA